MKKTDETKPTMSEQMIRNCKREVSKFGFDGEKYDEFLNAVGAMIGRNVAKYPNESISLYRDKFIKKHEYSVGDSFMFDRLSKIRTGDENGRSHETGYFCPRSFWDGVLKMK